MSALNEKNCGVIGPYDLKTTPVKILYGVMIVFCIILTFICLVPLLWIMLSSLKDIKEFAAIPPTIIPRSLHFEKIPEMWKTLNFGKYCTNSLFYVVGCVVCTVVFNGLAGYAISILKPKGSKVIFSLILWSLMVPATISMVPLFKNIVALKMIDSYFPLWLSYGATAFNVLLYKSFFDSIPRSLVEAARIDGCNDFKMFFKIVLPLSKAVNMVVMIFTLNAAWSDFMLPMLVLRDSAKHTVILKLYYMSTGNTLFAVDYRILAMCFSIIPPAILFIIFQKNITQGIALSGIKG